MGVARGSSTKVIVWCPHMFLWTGLGQGCLRDHFKGVLVTSKMKENMDLRIYGFQGEAGPEGEGWTRTE